MRKSWIFVIFLLSLYSCGSYTLQTNKGYEIKSILAVTEAGDTISVPYREFLNNRYDNYTRFNYNDRWYWNNWRYDYTWRWNYYWNFYPYQYNYSWNNYSNNYSYSNRPRVKPKTVIPRPGVTPGVIPKPKEDRVRINIGRNENNRINLRRPQQTQTRYNGGRSWNREVIPSQPTRPRFSTPSQPGQIRGGSRSPSIQQTQPRGGSSKQGGRPIDR